METKTNKEKTYFNVSIPHNDRISVKGSPTPAVYNVVRDESIIKGNPRDYNMSVVRFTIPTTFIPIQFFPVIQNPNNINDVNYSSYAITLSYLGNDYSEHLEWIPQDKDTIIPPPPTTPDFNLNVNPEYAKYYSCYSFNHFLSILNNALKKCFDNNILPLLPAPSPNKTYNPPFFVFDGSTYLFSVIVSDLFINNVPNPIELYFNSALNTNFDSSFHTEYYGYTPVYKNVNFVFRPLLKKITNDTEESGFVYEYTQEYDSTGLLTDFRNIIIRSNSLPIRNEGISIQGTNGQISTGNISVITDFEIDQGSLRNQKSFIHYIPTAEYRRIEMLGNSSLKHITLEILWGDNFDNLYPVLIPAHDKATIKLYFEEK